MSHTEPKPTVRIGGLLRCCSATLADYLETSASSEIGAVLTCKYCHSESLLLAPDRVWEWNQKKGINHEH